MGLLPKPRSEQRLLVRLRPEAHNLHCSQAKCIEPVHGLSGADGHVLTQGEVDLARMHASRCFLAHPVSASSTMGYLTAG